MKLPHYLSFVNKSLLLLALYIFLSLVLMNFSNPDSLRGVRWAMLKTVEWVHSVQQSLDWSRELAVENEALKQENFDLHFAQQQLREMILENRRLKKMLQLKEKMPYRFVAAQVIGQSSELGFRSLILNVGAQDSVAKNMAVVNADGLVGKVVAVTQSQSIVQILVDHNAFVSARLESSRETGDISWSGKAWLLLNNVPKTVDVLVGEAVVTSGLSRIYPPGIKIGIVSSIDENQYAFFKEIKVKPAVDFGAVEEVFVIRDKPAENPARE